MILISILAFLIIFTALILVHEWGHFTAARKFGVKVEEFGLGLPPAAKTLFKDKKGTEYTLNWLPLGGFVRMKGEDTHDSKLLKSKDSFAAQPVWQRIIIVCAGVFMNFVTGFVLLSIVFMLGTSYLVPTGETERVLSERPGAELVSEKNMGILIQKVSPDGAAATAEIKPYDFIAAVDGQPLASIEAFQELASSKAGQPLELSMLRRNFEFTEIVTSNEDGKIGVVISAPMTSVQLRYPPVQAVAEAGKETVRLTGLIFSAIGGLFQTIFTTASLPDDIGGPVAIAKETFYRSTDIIALLNFAAMLSITLAVFNILPIPALDGGRLFFLIIEGITRRRPSPRFEASIHAAGFVALMGLIVLITWKDIFG